MIMCYHIAMNPQHPARIRLRTLLRRQPQPKLAEAALCIAWEDQGVANIAAALRELDGLAEAAQPRLPAGGSPHDTVLALNRFLFGELGFRGNTWDYSDPANSFLDRVLATRFGAKAVELILARQFGVMVASAPPDIVPRRLEEVTGRCKTVPSDYDVLVAAKALGVTFGD